MPLEIDINIKDERWNDSLQDIHNQTQSIISFVLSTQINADIYMDISIVLADNQFIQNLNKTYRGKDKPTNVLSFPQTDTIEEIAPPICSLGDVIIAYETIIAEALEQNKSPENHYTHMLVHGCLHLLHYDHETEDEAKIMENLEIEILKKLDIKNPYAMQ